MSELTNVPLGEPERPTRLIRIKEVQHRVGLGRSTIYRWMAQGKFPRPVQLGGHAVAWTEDQLDEWISAKME
tara:strand:- start:424 stop:639 length:216 start_codon:yes stop_codon:yes gene_type:complete